MSDQNKYALNTVSGVVGLVDVDLLDHPTFGADYVEVEEPGVCIPCGAQPTEVTTIHGENIVLVEPEVAEEKPASSRASKPRPKEAK